MKEEDRKLWTERINDYRASGLTAVKWVEDRQVAIHKLRYCINKFNNENKLIFSDESIKDCGNTKWSSVALEKSIVEEKPKDSLRITICKAAIEVTDLRKSIDGLAIPVIENFKLDLLIIYSVIETAKPNNLNSFYYLTYLFESLPNTDLENMVKLDKLLPWSNEIPTNCMSSQMYSSSILKAFILSSIVNALVSVGYTCCISKPPLYFVI